MFFGIQSHPHLRIVLDFLGINTFKSIHLHSVFAMIPNKFPNLSSSFYSHHLFLDRFFCKTRMLFTSCTWICYRWVLGKNGRIRKNHQKRKCKENVGMPNPSGRCRKMKGKVLESTFFTKNVVFILQVVATYCMLVLHRKICKTPSF